MNKSIRNFGRYLLTWAAILHYLFLPPVLTLIGCKDEIKDLQPKSAFELSNAPLTAFNFVLDSNNLNAQLRFDTIAQGGVFTVSFTPFTYGTIELIDEGKSIQIVMQRSNWKRDSSMYTICKNGVCRSGEIKIENSSYKKPTDPDPDPEPIDSTAFPCVQMPVRTIFLSFFGTIKLDNLFTPGALPRVETYSTLHYTVSLNPDTSFQYFGGGGAHEQNWAWDTIYYSGKNAWNRCYVGKIAIVLGDTCEPHARNDQINVPAEGNIIFSEQVLVANDRGCSNQLGSFITRTDTEFDYGNYKVMNLNKGVLVDTLIGGVQHYRYRFTDVNAIEDGFYYYFKNMSSARVTKAWVRLRRQ